MLKHPPEVTSWAKSANRFWKYISFGTYVWFLRQIDQAMQNYSIVKLAQFWRSFSLSTTSSLPRCNFVLHGSFLLKIYTYLPKLMYFQILLKDFVRNVYFEDVWANTDGPLLFACFGGRRKCGVWWAIMPWFQGPARWEKLLNCQTRTRCQCYSIHPDWGATKNSAVALGLRNNMLSIHQMSARTNEDKTTLI